MEEYIVEPNCSYIGCGCELKEEVIRCRDCKYCNFENKCTKFGFDNGVIFHAHKVKPNGFCAWSERRG